MNAARLSIRAWVGLLFLLYILCELNALRCGMRLINGAPTTPVTKTGQTVAMIIGTKGSPTTIYVTGHQQLVYDWWLSGGMLALLLGLGLVFGYGIRLALAERRAKSARIQAPPRRLRHRS